MAMTRMTTIEGGSKDEEEMSMSPNESMTTTTAVESGVDDCDARRPTTVVVVGVDGWLDNDNIGTTRRLPVQTRQGMIIIMRRTTRNV